MGSRRPFQKKKKKKWLQDSIHLPILHQAASESVVCILLVMETVATEEVEVSMEEVVAEDV